MKRLTVDNHATIAAHLNTVEAGIRGVRNVLASRDRALCPSAALFPSNPRYLAWSMKQLIAARAGFHEECCRVHLRDDIYARPERDDTRVPAYVRLVPGLWVIDCCPFCGEKHTHGAGGRKDDPRKFLGSRVPHCAASGWSNCYELVEQTRERFALAEHEAMARYILSTLKALEGVLDVVHGYPPAKPINRLCAMWNRLNGVRGNLADVTYEDTRHIGVHCGHGSFYCGGRASA